MSIGFDNSIEIDYNGLGMESVLKPRIAAPVLGIAGIYNRLHIRA